MKNIHLIMLFLVLMACHPDQNRAIDLNDFRMKTSDGSRLYFDNVRKSNYNIEELAQAGINIYSLKSVTDTTLTAKIIHNWRMDQAYLQFAHINPTSNTLSYLNQENVKVTMSVRDLNFKEQTKNALAVYNLILANSLIFKDPQMTDTLIFDKEGFRITCFDYLRLTDNR